MKSESEGNLHMVYLLHTGLFSSQIIPQLCVILCSLVGRAVPRKGKGHGFESHHRSLFKISPKNFLPPTLLTLHCWRKHKNSVYGHLVQ